MLWIIYATGAQLINATVSLVDRFMVRSKKVANPFFYALYVCALSAFAVIAFVFGGIPGLENVFPAISGVDWSPPFALSAISFASGITFFLALYFLYESLKTARASDVMPVVGAVSAVTTLGLEATMGVRFGATVLAGVVLIVAGTLLISKMHFSKHERLIVLLSGISFGFHAITLSLLFTVANFDSGFFWSRAGMAVVAGAAYLLIYLPYYKATKRTKPTKTSHAKGIAWVLGNKALAGVGAILVLRAIEQGSVTVVQALGGLQFVFLLIFGVFLGKKFVQSGEEHTKSEVINKIFSVLLISIGFACLFI